MLGASTPLIDLLDRRLHQLHTSRPDLETAVQVQGVLLRQTLSSPREPLVEPFPLPRERLLAKLHTGIPALHDEPASVDVDYAAELFGRLLDSLSDWEKPADPFSRVRVQALADAAASGRLDLDRLFTEAFVQHPDHLAELAGLAGVDHDLLPTLARQAVAPLLQAYARHLLPLIERGPAWERGYCPVCGGWPVLAELRGVEQAQHLRCSACGSAWRARRLACPYCGTDDSRLLHTLRVAGEECFSVSVCDQCRGYLKVGNGFDPTPSTLLPLDDLASMHLDLVAIERGYERPAGSGFRIELGVPGEDEEEW
ncbi:MAG TPA: formate dehydrogenase accessory protein FdhE [Chloroflexota bacterium]|nr:formate dehydrogenase accessory protein FdhE [Chloroflexota bacterium]